MVVATRSQTATGMSGAERNLRWFLRITGAIHIALIVMVYVDRFLLKGKLGYAWWPAMYEVHGNTTLEFEMMIIGTYFGLGLVQVYASYDDNLDKAIHLVNALVVGAWGAHDVAMIAGGIWDWGREKNHFMPWGDIPVLLALALTGWYLKNAYINSKKD